MSRKNSRGNLLSQRTSRCSSVDSLDTLDEETEFKHFINRQEVLAEDEFEDEDSEEKVITPQKSRRVSTVSTPASLPASNCPSRSWSRRSSPTRGELLKADDEMVTVNRGGMTMTIPRHLAHHIPHVLLGHLDDEGREICDKMCKEGYSPEEIIEFFKTYTSAKSKIEARMQKFLMNHKSSEKDKMRVLKSLLEGTNMSKKDFLDLVKQQFGDSAQQELELLMKSGLTMQEAMDEYMRGAEKREREELKNKLQNILDNQDLSEEEKFQAMMETLGAEEQEKIKQLMKSGLSFKEAMSAYLKEVEKKEKEDRKARLNNILDNDQLTETEKFKAMSGDLSMEEQKRIKELMKSGMTLKEAMAECMNEAEQREKDELKTKLQGILDDPNLTNEEKMKAMMNAMSLEEQLKIQELLNNGMSMDEIMKQLAEGGGLAEPEQSEFAKRFQEMMDGKSMTEEEMLEAMKNNLGSESRKEMERMLAAGYSMQDVLKHFMKNGKTEEEEQKELQRKIQDALDGGNLSTSEAYSYLQNNLSDEAKSTMDELLKQGYTMEEIVELFKKHGNNIGAIDSELANQTIDFGDEDPNAHLYANRDVFTVISQEAVCDQVPLMTPKKQPCSFREFITKVKSIVEGKGLTHREILDIMEFRMGGSFLADMRTLRRSGKKLADIVEFFLQKDQEQRHHNQRMARLKADSKVDEQINLNRKKIKQSWGIQLSYTYSDEFGLHLVLVGVDQSGPAWNCGVRPGDVIVTVDDWLITVMDRPHVAMHLLQAGANQVRLGIKKSGSSQQLTQGSLIGDL